MMQGFGSLKDILPHAPPMILLDRVQEWTLEKVHTQLTIQETSLFMGRQGVPSYIGLEYMAQTAGVWNGIRALQLNESPKRGYLLGTRTLRLHVPFFEKGWHLDIYAEIDFMDAAFGSFKAWIECQKKKLVEANITVFQERQGDEVRNT